jgi:hypothetical protein
MIQNERKEEECREEEEENIFDTLVLSYFLLK